MRGAAVESQSILTPAPNFVGVKHPTQCTGSKDEGPKDE